jgi:bifunctional non-homologous end joining protein LigD
VPLDKYRSKRDFSKTTEPAGARAETGTPETAEAKQASGPLFVIQKHAAHRLHYDFRLELDGVLVSWAIPKGPSLDAHDKRLAVRVEDHPLEYGSFEGTIPAGEYGAGTVELWDRGWWEPEGDSRTGLQKGDMKITLHGEKLKGSWALVRMKPRPGQDDGENWLLIKHRDEYAVDGENGALLDDEPRSVASGRTIEQIAAARDASLPQFVSPQLATLVAKTPDGDGWLHEVKFDGYRILARIEKGSVTLWSRNRKNWTDRYPAVAEELARLPVESAIIDGELVVQLPDGSTSFQALQNLSRSKTPEAGGGRLLYYAFDLLHLDGRDLIGARLDERKRLLERVLGGAAGRILFSQHVAGTEEGDRLFAQACRFGLEGVVSKRRDSAYRPGARTGDWQKSKCRHQQEFVIAGYTDPAGSRVGFGALVLGVQGDGGLHYAGKVGTGFDDKLLRDLAAQLHRLEIKKPVLGEVPPPVANNAHWVKPQLVAEVAFAEWTREGLIRHASFKGLREDKPAEEVSAEEPQAIDEGSPKQKPDHPAVKLTHLDRIFWPDTGYTKRDLVEYYLQVADRMLPYVAHRPVAMVRCPGGMEGPQPEARQNRDGPCFFHKHPGSDFPGPFERVRIVESPGPGVYLTIIAPGSLVALAQMGVLEIHIWGSTWPEIERPDMVVFDLDPDPDVSWPVLAEGARMIRATLDSVGLQSFVKTTGGKGLHVVVPITPSEKWGPVHDFAKAVAQSVEARQPDRYTSNMSKARRTGKIFVDYVRNNRGATSVAPFSSRARAHATVAVPLAWDELESPERPRDFTIKDLGSRLCELKRDPWSGYFEAANRQSLTDVLGRI